MHKRHGIFYGWIIVFVSLTVTTTAFGVLYSFGVFFKGWLREWDCSRAFLSGVFSLCFLMYGIASFFMGNLTDRYGPRKTLALGGFVMGAGAFLTSIVCQAWVLYITFGLMIGIGVGTSYSPTASTVSRWFLEKKGVAVGIVVSGLGLGTLIYSPLARFLISFWNWRTTFVIFGMMIWTTYFIAAFILRKNPQDLGLEPYGHPSAAHATEQSTIGIRGQGSPVSQTSTGSTREALREFSFWILFVVHCCWVLGMAIPMAHFFPYATDVGISPSQAAFMLAILGGVSVLGRVALGGLAEKMGTKNSLIFLLLSQMSAMLWLVASRSPWMLWIFSFFFGFSYGGLASVFPLITAEYFGLFSMGSIFGLILLGATLGGVIGPLMAGYIFDVTQKYSLGFLVGAGSMATGVILSFRLPSRILTR